MAALGVARSAAAIAAVVGLAAAPLERADDAAGAWEMSLDGSHRKCRVTLRSEEAGAARPLRFPAGCRRALPILNEVTGWGFDNGLVRFLAKDSQPVLAFEPRTGEEEGFVARTSTGETYILELKDKQVQPEHGTARLMPPLLARPAPPPPTPVDPEKAPPFAAVPGVYAVDRYLEREVCRVSLGIAMLDASGRFEARLLDGCHDNGLQVFDPVAWRYAAGRITLQARRGHEVTLISEREGQWRRDPDVGATLVLRKAGP